MPNKTPWHWPGRCGICRQWCRPAGLCTDCLARFARPVARCSRCAARVPEGVPTCGSCLHAPPRFELAHAALDYAFPWSEAIAELKFGHRLEWAAALSRLLAGTLPQDHRQVDIVTAVPLSPVRMRRRGFNQAWEIARRTASQLGLAARHDLIGRWRDTPSQAALGRPERQTNLRGAFMPAGREARRMLHGRTVALVDDVMTTGATAEEATQALLEGGARSVHVWVVARTGRADD